MTAGHTGRAHSVLSPSKAHRWSRCPGSALAEAEYPDTPASKESMWGTACHELAEKAFQCGASAALPAKWGTWKAGNGVAWSLEMGETAEVYRQHLLQSKPMSTVWQVEQRMHFPRIHPECFGTADAQAIVPFHEVHVVDLKGGAGVTVEAVDNEQLVIYASPGLDHNVEQAVATIVQPRCREGAPIKTWVFSGDELAERVAGLSEAAHEAMRPNALRRAGDHCKWCRAAADCPTLRKHALATAQQEFADVPATVPTLVSPLMLTSEQLGNVLRLAPVFETWIEAVRARAFSAARAGELPGYKIVEGKLGNRAWRDKDSTATTLDTVGVDPWEKVLISPADAERALVVALQGSDGGTKKDATAKAKKVLDDLVSRAPGRPVLAPESDPRPALALSAADDFADPLPE